MSKINFYCINTSEIQGELSRVNMISSHVKITTCFKIAIAIAIATYSLKKYSDVLLYDRNIIGPSSEIFGGLRKSSEMFGIVRQAYGTILENLRKSSKSDRKSSENRQKRRY